MKSIFYICGQCKSPLAEGVQFCTACGRRVIYKKEQEEKGKPLEMSWDKAKKGKDDPASIRARQVEAEVKKSSEALKTSMDADKKAQEEKIAKAKEEELKARREEALRKAREVEETRKKELEEKEAQKRAAGTTSYKEDQAKELTKSFKAAAAAKSVVPNTAAGPAPGSATTVKKSAFAPASEPIPAPVPAPVSTPVGSSALKPTTSGAPMKRKAYVLQYGDKKTKRAFTVAGVGAILAGIATIGILGEAGTAGSYWWTGAMLAAAGFLLLGSYSVGMARLYNWIMAAYVVTVFGIGTEQMSEDILSPVVFAAILWIYMLIKMKKIKVINKQYDQYARQITISASAGEGHRIYTSSSYHYTVKSTDRWKQLSDTGAFDLKLFNETSELYFYVMAYKKSEIKAGNLARRVLELQLKDLQGKLTNVKELSPVEEIKTSDKTMYQTMFSAERDGSVNYYLTRGIELLLGDEVLWVMANGRPDDLLKTKEEILSMMDGITYKK